MMGGRLLAFKKISSQKANKVVEADARATQPGFRLSPLFGEGGVWLEKKTLQYTRTPKFKSDFKERRA
jgi:hypothetical protein